MTYTYDNGGNILSVKEYDYTTVTDLSALTPNSINTYTYDNDWKDKLASYNGNTITYDAIGNPLSYYNGYAFTWQNGRQLATISGNGINASYKYNSDGIRTSKTVDNVTTTYTLEGSNIVKETKGTDTLWYYYDAAGSLIGFEYNDDPYFYVKNYQGDIIAITDESGTQVVTYLYDSWGKVLDIDGTAKDTIGEINPFRYRGYYYDEETGLYYLNSRYYDPNTKRFINADGITDGGARILGNNLFIYSANNPINNSDSSGQNIIKDTANWLYKKLVQTPLSSLKTGIKKLATKAKPYVKLAQAKLKARDFTASIGQTGNFNSPISFGKKYSIAIDSDGNIGGFSTSSFGVSTSVSLSSTTAIEITNARNISSLTGNSLSLGGSLAVNFPYTPTFLFGAEKSWFESNGKNYSGGAFNTGISTPDFGLGFDFNYSYTKEPLWSFNLFDDVLEPVYDHIMEW